MTKRQLVKWLEAKQSDAKAEVEIQYATAEKAYFAQRDEALKINETVLSRRLKGLILPVVGTPL